MNLLNIGGGNLPLEGYINIDKYYYPGSAWPLTNQKKAQEWEEGRHEGQWIRGDALKLQFSSDTFDEVNMSHVLEHLSMEEGNHALMEAYRVLKPGGFAVIGVPDLAAACSLYQTVEYKDGQDNSMWFYVMGMIYGTTGKDGEGQFHHCGYSREYLAEKMRVRNFKDIQEVPTPEYHKQEFNFCLKGYK